jgi:DTW domain-containing protein
VESATSGTCPACGKPAALCVCAVIRPVETRTEVLILQHPQEPDRELGSARLAQLCLTRGTLRVGLSWRNLSAALGRTAQTSGWMVLYLGSARPDPAGPRLLALDRRGKPLADQRAALSSRTGLIVLDGTWSQAKTLWWRNAWLLKLQRVVLAPPGPSLYAMLRREPRAEALSTIESLGLALAELEGRPEIIAELERPFRKLLERCRQR